MFVTDAPNILTKVLDRFAVMKKTEYLSILIALKDLTTKSDNLNIFYTLKEIEEVIPSTSDFILLTKESKDSRLIHKKLNNFLNNLLKSKVVTRTYYTKKKAAGWKFNKDFLIEENLLLVPLTKEQISEDSIPCSEIMLGEEKTSVIKLPAEKENPASAAESLNKINTLITNKVNKFPPSTHKSTTLIPAAAIEPKNPEIVTNVKIPNTPELPEVKRIQEAQAEFDAMFPRVSQFNNFNKPRKNVVEIPYFCCYRLIKKVGGGIKQKTFSSIFSYPEEFFYEEDALDLVDADIRLKHSEINIHQIVMLSLNPLVIV